MRALKFNIQPETLLLYDFTQWPETDRGFIRQTAHNNNTTLQRMHEDDGRMICKGKLEDLFTFLYELSHRYDIELV